MEFNRFDVSAKELVWDNPAAWLERFAIGPRGPVEVIDSDITTLTASADKVLKVGGPDPYLVDLEPHSYHDASLTRTLWFRQVALDYRHDLPVLTVLVLLCKEANSPGLTGTYERQVPDGWLTNRYHYRVVRLWQENPEDYLTAEVGLVPLAPLTNVAEVDLPEVVRRMAGRINVEPRPRAAKLWTATYLLMGVRYPDDVVNQLLEGIQTMRESSTYQAILSWCGGEELGGGGWGGVCGVGCVVRELGGLRGVALGVFCTGPQPGEHSGAAATGHAAWFRVVVWVWGVEVGLRGGGVVVGCLEG